MIALLACSINSSANNIGDSSTGEGDNRVDSVLIAYDDLRIANSKMIELEYEKEINVKLKEVLSNDSIIIADYSKLNEKLNKDCNKLALQRNICFGVAFATFITSILLIVK